MACSSEVYSPHKKVMGYGSRLDLPRQFYVSQLHEDIDSLDQSPVPQHRAKTIEYWTCIDMQCVVCCTCMYNTCVNLTHPGGSEKGRPGQTFGARKLRALGIKGDQARIRSNTRD